MSTLLPEPLPSYNTIHHQNNKFINNPGEPEIPRDIVSSMGPRSIWRQIKVGRDYTTAFPVHPPTFSRPPGIRCYWLGHATNLIEFNNLFILTDPVFGDHASPFRGMVKRVTPAGCTIDKLPRISVILLSHDHWDHLEANSLQEICSLSPGVQIFAPLGVSDLLTKWGHKPITFDWRQKVTYRGIDFFCMPARHASARYGYDWGSRLWCSWLIKADIAVYFPGDTGIGPHFHEVRQVAGRPIDLVMMPIGPTQPVAMMRAVHLNPEDAVDAAEALEARCVFPIHWGAFGLGTKPEVDDITALRNVWRGDNLFVIDVGEGFEWDGQAFIRLSDMS
jgi:L-ascorbate metabolism protein UlaG (beta-lactamase superfamily)